MKGAVEDVIRENGGYSNRLDQKIRGVSSNNNGRLSEGETGTIIQTNNRNSGNDIGSIRNEDGDNGGIKYSRIKVSGIQASKDYAQHMQDKILVFK